MVQRWSTWALFCIAFPTYILAIGFALHHLLIWWCHRQFAPPLVNGLFSQQQHPRWMFCLVLSVLPHQCSSSEVNSRQNYLRVHTSNLTEFVCASLIHYFCSMILKSLFLCHVNDYSNTNQLTTVFLTLVSFIHSFSLILFFRISWQMQLITFKMDG